MGKHLLETHSDEAEIMKLKLREDSGKGALHLKELRFTGNCRHNLGRLETGKGNLIVLRSPKFDSDVINIHHVRVV